MSQTIIQVESISKRYQLGTIGYGSLQHDLTALWAKIRGKEDPNARIGEKSRLDLHGEFWALRDVSFSVQQGDRVGIIGRNGAGKSTLLKLLSRVTSPTEGRIKVRGRIASLLEVGTGFHPELTGRENVFLNGAILGMKRREIQAKFDEIVAFAGVEQFIDTPVKRYSSGMYVRLAFSVAAHLESEILIVDEVLAVGDAEFQKKCLGKMEDVSKGEGRTVLFVSHQISLLEQFCNSGLYLEKGLSKATGTFASVLAEYQTGSGWVAGHTMTGALNLSSLVRVTTLKVNDSTENELGITVGDRLTVSLDFEITGKIQFGLEIYCRGLSGQVVGYYSQEFLEDGGTMYDVGTHRLEKSFHFPRQLIGGTYTLDLMLSRRGVEGYFSAPTFVRLDVRGYSSPSGQPLTHGQYNSILALE